MSSAVAVLGLGAMGSRMAARLLKAGYQVTVWNRSPEKAQALLEAGARWAASPREAASGADVVIAMVRDDEASQQVWCDVVTGALAGMRPGAVAIESSTLSLGAVRALADAAAQAGVTLLDAPVSGSRPAAEAGLLLHLVGGDAAAFQAAQPVLLAMGTAAHHVGPAGCGAAAKLVTNALLGIHVGALAELMGLLAQQGLATEPILRAVADTPVWAPVDNYLCASMMAQEFRPQFPIELMAKDFSYAVAAAGKSRLPLVSAALGAFQEALNQGLGDRNMTAVAKLYAPQTSA
jgi:3-hydroxyisobutyrate dehydrogenase